VPDFASTYTTARAACESARTMQAELGLSGRAGEEKLRGRALVGFEKPDAMRLEGLAPFGAPAFILAARGREATLLLPRDDRVLRSASAAEILGALTGVSLAPADLQAILTGCVTAAPKAVGGTQYGADWRSIDLEDGAKIYLRREGGAWPLRAAVRGEWRIEYAAPAGAFPQSVRLVHAEAPVVDLTAQISQLEANVPVDPAAFAVDVPRDALPITLEELRDAGPLRATTSR